MQRDPEAIGYFVIPALVAIELNTLGTLFGFNLVQFKP
jgi:hypothetical protein